MKKSKKPTTKAAKTKVATKSKKVLLTSQLKRLNLIVAAAMFAQAVAIVVLSKAHSLPVVGSFLTQDPMMVDSAGRPAWVSASRHLIDVRPAYVIAAFLIVAGVTQLLTATTYRKQYEADLKEGISRFRWVEYSIAGSLMLVLLAMLVGVVESSTLALIAGLSVVSGLSVMSMELHSRTLGRQGRISKAITIIAGFLPWVIIAKALAWTSIFSSVRLPWYAYAAAGTTFVLYLGCIAVMELNRKGKGRWADYMVAERAYLALSVVSKTALAWIVFAGLLR